MSKNSRLILFIFCLLKLGLHLIADSNSGFQGDELLHIETGKHLALGYQEFPPMIGLLAFIQNLFQSQSVYVHHIFAHIASILVFIYAAKITFTLGGKERAIFLVLLCLLIAPGLGRSQQLFQPVVFSQLFWVLGFYQLLKFCKTTERKHLLYLAALSVIGFLTKYDMLFFIAGLAALLLYKSTRTLLIKNKFWLIIMVGILIILPNLIWQYNHNFPAVQMFSRLYEKQLNEITRFKNLSNMLLAMNPLSLLLSLPAILFFIFKKQPTFIKVAGTSILISFLLLLITNGKSYYFFSLIITLLPFGAVYWELIMLPNKKWVFYPLALLLVAGALLIPFGMPVTSFTYYLKNEYPFEKEDVAGTKYAVKYEERYSTNKWKETLSNLKAVYDSLPTAEKNNTIIWAKHYAQAGGIIFFGRNYNLPEAFSLHGSFYNWVPKGAMPQTIIAIRNSDETGKDFFEPYFEEVIPVRKMYNPYANEEEKLYQTIFICKGPKQSFEGLKILFKDRVFE